MWDVGKTEKNVHFLTYESFIILFWRRRKKIVVYRNWSATLHTVISLISYAVFPTIELHSYHYPFLVTNLLFKNTNLKNINISSNTCVFVFFAISIWLFHISCINCSPIDCRSFCRLTKWTKDSSQRARKRKKRNWKYCCSKIHACFFYEHTHNSMIVISQLINIIVILHNFDVIFLLNQRKKNPNKMCFVFEQLYGWE